MSTLSNLQWFLAGIMAGWTPSLLVFAVLLVRAPTLREDEEVPSP